MTAIGIENELISSKGIFRVSNSHKTIPETKERQL
jgi:hypothetical protein